MTEPMTDARLTQIEARREEAELELIALAQHNATRRAREVIAARRLRARLAAKEA